MLQQLLEDGNSPLSKSLWAVTAKISAMNFTHSVTAPFSTFLTCTFPSTLPSSSNLHNYWLVGEKKQNAYGQYSYITEAAEQS